MADDCFSSVIDVFIISLNHKSLYSSINTYLLNAFLSELLPGNSNGKKRMRNYHLCQLICFLLNFIWAKPFVLFLSVWCIPVAITSSVITFISFGFFFVKKFRLNLNLGVSKSLEVGLDIEELWKNFLLLILSPTTDLQGLAFGWSNADIRILLLNLFLSTFTNLILRSHRILNIDNHLIKLLLWVCDPLFY